MAETLTNSITSYLITWMDNGFGWITLLNGNDEAGYVYILPDSDPLRTPHLSAKKTYIVMSIHLSRLGDFLSILRNEMPLQIRYFDSQVPGSKPSAFIESRPLSLGKTEDALKIFKQLPL
jgi:hypothetical protein